MLATVLAKPAETPLARAALWRQLVDLAAQRRGGNAALSAAAGERLRELRADMPEAVRAEMARALAGRTLPPAVVALFAEEPAAIAAPLLRTARMAEQDWLAILPAMPATARALLRHRRDLGAAIGRALESFGAADFAIAGAIGVAPDTDASQPASAAEAPPPDASLAPAPLAEPEPISHADAAANADGGAQIRALMARIAAFRARRSASSPAPVPSVPLPDIGFRFETGADGVVGWVAGIARGALIGETIAVPGEGARGVDGQAAGAYRRRAPFRDARISIAGGGEAAGEWRISAVPFFDTHEGRFLGYRGTGRRPRADESAVAQAPASGLFGSGMAADSLRQLVHELRTPINAISGFAEMIEHQMLGPAEEAYRARAVDIVHHAARLLGAIDDLDLAARIETQRLALTREPVDLARVLAGAVAEHATLAAERGATVPLDIAADAPPAAGDRAAFARMCGRLLGAAIGLAAPGETIAVTLRREPERLRIDVARPALLADSDERALLDPGYGPEGDSPDAPALGLGFSLRLVRNLAAAAQGALEIAPDAFVLRLPAAIDETRAEGRAEP